MHVCIVGAGKVGYYLAKTLLEHGHDPVVIEQDPQACRRIADAIEWHFGLRKEPPEEFLG